MTHAAILFFPVAFLAALAWRTNRINKAHAKIAALEKRITELESLIQEPIVKMDAKMKAAQLRQAG